MKRIFLILWSIFTALLMISTVSAVPKVNSDPIMDKIDVIEEYKKLIDEEVNDMLLDVETGGLIDILIQLIQWIINFVQQLISLILQIFGLVDLIEYLINLIVTLYEVIMAFIDFILSIFTPNGMKI